ncbi:MAG TPA: type II secretion system F family protein [Pontiellaceae bacterium]|nr:type II secretion system F family protein [Pontiellaceae bacterium]HPR82988.1 type II secretion system F family protein [Pontiellaceae bacterium]
MPTFKYIARGADGKRVDGTLIAADRRAALQMLQQAGHTPLSIDQIAEKVSTASVKKRFKFESGLRHKTQMGARDTLLFTREMADLLSSGMTLGRALHTLAQRKDESVQSQIVKRLRDEVVQGSSLSDALRIYPDTFQPLYISMVRAGEASGALADSLAGLCSHYERVQEARSKVITAMIYPAIVLGVGMISLIGLMVFIIPRFASIFDELGGTLPLPTRILMAMSNGMIHYGWLMLILLAAGGITLRRWMLTPAGKLWWNEKQLKLPIVRKITTANAFAHFARTLETLIRNGVPILKALVIVQETVGNEVIAKEIAAARDRVTDGSSVSGPLAAGKVFPPLLTDMLAVGEETGDLPGALKHIARRYDAELDQSIKVLTTVLEPVLILGVAVIVGFVAISMLTAVFDLTSGLGV